MLWSLMVLTACRGDKDEVVSDDSAVSEDDTQVSDTEDTDVVLCEAKPAELWPEDEADDHYIRDDIQVLFTQPAPEASFTLATSDGTEVDLTWTWNASEELATLSVTLDPLVVYVLGIDVCEEHFESRFKTSEWGLPLQDGPSSLVDRTYVVELGGVEFTEPPDIGNLLALYLDVPILLGVRDVTEDGTEMSLLGAQGFVDGQGVYRQRKKRMDSEGQQWTVPTWDFAAIDFTQAPFFSGDAVRVELLYQGRAIPVHDFHLEATFSEDGESFGEGRLWGKADTRNLGELIDSNADDPDQVVCDLVGGAGIECEPCPDDGAPYCLFLRGEEIAAERVPDLILERIEESEPVN